MPFNFLNTRNSLNINTNEADGLLFRSTISMRYRKSLNYSSISIPWSSTSNGKIACISSSSRLICPADLTTTLSILPSTSSRFNKF